MKLRNRTFCTDTHIEYSCDPIQTRGEYYFSPRFISKRGLFLAAKPLPVVCSTELFNLFLQIPHELHRRFFDSVAEVVKFNNVHTALSALASADIQNRLAETSGDFALVELRLKARRAQKLQKLAVFLCKNRSCYMCSPSSSIYVAFRLSKTDNFATL